MDTTLKSAWDHLIIDLKTSRAQIAREMKITRQAVQSGLANNASKPVQVFVLKKAIVKGVRIPKSLLQLQRDLL